jgi:hypothetical protein
VEEAAPRPAARAWEQQRQQCQGAAVSTQEGAAVSREEWADDQKRSDPSIAWALYVGKLFLYIYAVIRFVYTLRRKHTGWLNE